MMRNQKSVRRTKTDLWDREKMYIFSRSDRTLDERIAALWLHCAALERYMPSLNKQDPSQKEKVLENAIRLDIPNFFPYNSRFCEGAEMMPKLQPWAIFYWIELGKKCHFNAEDMLVQARRDVEEEGFSCKKDLAPRTLAFNNLEVLKTHFYPHENNLSLFVRDGHKLPGNIAHTRELWANTYSGMPTEIQQKWNRVLLI